MHSVQLGIQPYLQDPIPRVLSSVTDPVNFAPDLDPDPGSGFQNYYY